MPRAAAWGRDLAHALGVEGWLRDHLARPNDDSLRNALAATAAATGSVLGLLVSISLIVWQAAADRYGSGRIVEFLLRERIASATVRILAVAFSYSLLLLLVIETIQGQRPYVSTIMALALGAGGVVSVITYRVHALLGYQPRNIARGLAEEIMRETARAVRPHAGRSVQDYARRVVDEDLQTIAELLRRLVAVKDPVGLAAVATAIGSSLEHYLLVKHQIRDNASWFERRRVPLGTDWGGIEQRLASQGLMQPTNEEPDREWFERKALALLSEIGASNQFADAQVAQACIAASGRALQRAWFAEEAEVVDLMIAEVGALSARPAVLADAALLRAAGEVAWVIVDMAGRGLAVSSEQIVAAKPWQHDIDRLGLPRMARAHAEALAGKIRRERLVCGQVVTPVPFMVAEVERARGPEVEQFTARVMLAGWDLAYALLEQAVAASSPTAAAGARMAGRVLMRCVHYDAPIAVGAELVTLLVAAYEHADAAEQDDFRQDLGRIARALSEADRTLDAYAYCKAFMLACVIARVGEPDTQPSLRIVFDGLFTVALLHAWGEWRSEPGHLLELSRYLAPPFHDLDALREMIEKDAHFTTALMMGLPSVTYHEWFQRISLMADRLPDHLRLPEDGFPFAVEDGKEHPSSLFADWAMLSGHDECLAHLIHAAAALRAVLRPQLVDALSQLMARRTT